MCIVASSGGWKGQERSGSQEAHCEAEEEDTEEAEQEQYGYMRRGAMTLGGTGLEIHTGDQGGP